MPFCILGYTRVTIDSDKKECSYVVTIFKVNLFTFGNLQNYYYNGL